MPRTLLDKVWDAHTLRTPPSGQTRLLAGLHLIHDGDVAASRPGAQAVTAPKRLEGALRTPLEWVVDMKLVLSCFPRGGQ